MFYPVSCAISSRTLPTQTTTKPHFSLLATSFAGGPRPRNAAITLFGLWFLLFFAALFAPPILDDADATHAAAARAMATTGDLVTLKVDGVRYLEKAPLPYWIAALSFRLFGFNTFAAHLPQAIAVLLLMLLGHRWANQAFGARTGFYTAVAVLTSTGVFLFTRILIPEVLLSLLLGAGLFAFLRTLGPISEAEYERASHAPNPQSGTAGTIPERPSIAFHAGPLFYAYVMWATLALAVLTKGLVALVFFFATTLLFLALTNTLGDIRKLRPVTGILVFLAIAAPWHILAALRNPETPTHHGFLWFYFWNEHVLRFLGRRTPADFNKLPGWLYWSLNLVWLFPWTLFLPLGFSAISRRYRHQLLVLTARLGKPDQYGSTVYLVAVSLLLTAIGDWLWNSDALYNALLIPAMVGYACTELAYRRHRTGLTPSPFPRIDPQQRTILLLSLFSAIVLLFFSLSTNQEYYTFPVYLPILLLIAATITRAEQTYSTNPTARRALTFTHAAFTVLGGATALTLFYGLWASRHLPYLADIGRVLAHRGVGDYTLSMSHFFDLTAQSFAALRMPALLAALAFAFGPAFAWLLRVQRRHMAATTSIALTAAVFLFAAHLAFARFAPMLSSQSFAARIVQLECSGHIEPGTQVAILGDQAFGSSLTFYLDRPILMVDARSTSMLFGSTFPDTAPVFLSKEELLAQWGRGPRKMLFVPLERRADADALLGTRQFLVQETSGKALLTDRPLH